MSSRVQLGALLVDPLEEFYLVERCYWYLWAAWLDESGSAPSRRLAAAALGEMIEAGERYFRRAGEDFLVMADLHRRCGEFRAAAGWVSRGLTSGCYEQVRGLLDLEHSLIKTRDTGPHRDSEKPVGPPRETPETPASCEVDGEIPF